MGRPESFRCRIVRHVPGGQACDICSFVYEEVPVGHVAGILRDLCSQLADLLTDARALAVLRNRPAPDVWSCIEYGCHVRDVLLIQRDRVILALVEDCPSFPRMYRDERADLTGYGEESVDDLVAELKMAANLIAKVFDRLSEAQTTRPCVYNFPEPSLRDVAWLGRHTVHESKHHLGDVHSVLARLV